MTDQKITAEQAVQGITQEQLSLRDGEVLNHETVAAIIDRVVKCPTCMDTGQVVGGEGTSEGSTHWYEHCPDCELGKAKAESEERRDTIEFLQGFEQDTQELRAEGEKWKDHYLTMLEANEANVMEIERLKGIIRAVEDALQCPPDVSLREWAGIVGVAHHKHMLEMAENPPE